MQNIQMPEIAAALTKALRAQIDTYRQELATLRARELRKAAQVDAGAFTLSAALCPKCNQADAPGSCVCLAKSQGECGLFERAAKGECVFKDEPDLSLLKGDGVPTAKPPSGKNPTSTPMSKPGAQGVPAPAKPATATVPPAGIAKAQDEVSGPDACNCGSNKWSYKDLKAAKSKKGPHLVEARCGGCDKANTLYALNLQPSHLHQQHAAYQAFMGHSRGGAESLDKGDFGFDDNGRAATSVAQAAGSAKLAGGPPAKKDPRTIRGVPAYQVRLPGASLPKKSPPLPSTQPTVAHK